MRRVRRGAYPRENSLFIGAWFPRAWVRQIDELVVMEDLDRSKILRRAVQEKLKEKGGA